MTNTDDHGPRPSAGASGDGPWVMTTMPDRSLQVDVHGDVDEAQWDALLDAIIRRLRDIDRVRFVAAGLTPGEEELLNALMMVLERRGLDVEWR
jgi:hypothetical protein